MLPLSAQLKDLWVWKVSKLTDQKFISS